MVDAYIDCVGEKLKENKMKQYLGHEFESMGDDTEDSHLECKNCKMKSYFDSTDNEFYDFSGMVIITQSCEDYQKYQNGLTD